MPSGARCPGRLSLLGRSATVLVPDGSYAAQKRSWGQALTQSSRSVSTREDLSAGFAAELYVACWASIQLGEYGIRQFPGCDPQKTGDTVISPRANAVSSALSAGVYVVLEDYESAAAMVECVTRDASPEVGRFALRFIPDTVFQEISARQEVLSYDVAELIERAKPDRRTLKYDSPVRLTEVERETLTLLRDGRTTQEIADIRIVSPNTVKTQLRTLYRKLGVKTRHHAVQRARERGYL